MNDELMNRAEQVLAEEAYARKVATAKELLADDEKAQKAAALKARQDEARAEVKAMMTAEDVTLEYVAAKFDAAVSALADLANAAIHRNRTISEANLKMQGARLPEARGRNNEVHVDGVVHHVREAEPRTLLARALLIVCESEGTNENGFNQLSTDLTRVAGPLHRRTPVEKIRR